LGSFITNIQARVLEGALMPVAPFFRSVADDSMPMLTCEVFGIGR
jgi:hypothetical protein